MNNKPQSKIVFQIKVKYIQDDIFLWIINVENFDFQLVFQPIIIIMYH